MRHVTVRDIAWYFEGEGTLGYYHRSPGGFGLQTNITSTNKAILQAIQEVVGGTITVGHHKGAAIGHSGYRANKTSYKLEWSYKKAIAFLTLLEPCLPESSEKLPQIRLALKIGSMASATQAMKMKLMKEDMPTTLPFSRGQHSLPFESAENG